MRLSTERFGTLLDQAKSLIAKTFPIESDNYKIEVSNFRWENTEEKFHDDPDIHKEYKIKGKTLASRLIANARLLAKPGGKVIGQETNYPILVLPLLTNKTSFIVGGKEVQIVNQLRLKPGTYTRFMADNNVETFINAAGGGYRVQFDRERSIFRLRIGQSTYVYLYPILKALGATDSEIQAAWGREILTANQVYDDPSEVKKLYAKMRPYSKAPEDPAALATEVKSFFESKALDPNITKLTLGTSYNTINTNVLLDCSKKTIQLAHGQIKADDTENIAYKSLHSVEDFVLERIRDKIPEVQRYAIWSMNQARFQKDPKLMDALPPSVFSKSILAFFTQSEFARYSDQNNPLDMLGVSSLVTSLGEGGIQSVHAISDKLRAVHPSHMGVLDPVHTPESQKIGVTAHLALGARKIGNDLGLVVIEAKTGKRVEKKAFDLEQKVVAFHDQYTFSPTGVPKPKTPNVKARSDGELKEVPAAKVDYIFDAPNRMFGFVTNAVPFLHNNSPNRVLMAARHLEQAVPLANPDVPLVQSQFKNTGYEDAAGRVLVSKALTDGKVTRVRESSISIKGNDGKTKEIKLHHNYPLNSNAFLNEHPIVTVGQKVKTGDPIADSDFTRNGTLTLGKNLLTAFVPYKGFNFEDGVVISESAAQKLTSVHKHEMELEVDANVQVGLAKLLAHFPAMAEGVDRNKYDASGVVKVGSKLRHDELAIPAVRKIKVQQEFDYSKLHKALRNQWLDVSVKWDGYHEAEVVDVVKMRTFVKVYVKTLESIEIGDKLSHRAGGKGIVTKILPDNEMYRTPEGRTVDVLFNPSGVIGRANPGQIFEAAAGKIAEKTGKPFVIQSFDPRSSVDYIKAELKKNGLSDVENITDPSTGKVTENVMVGPINFVKLQHQVSKKLSARGISGYTQDETPRRSEKANPMSIGSMELYSLLAGGGTAFLRDATTIKSNRNDEFWRAVQLGLPTPPLKTPFIVDKFTTYMRGAGIDLKRDGTQLKALPLIDSEIKGQSNGEIRSPGAIRANDLAPEQGGLFDRTLTGGFDGNYWNHIELESPIPNPLMDHAIISVLKIKASEFDDLVNGRLFVTPDGKFVTQPNGNKTGGAALKQMLGKIDVDSEISKALHQARSTSGATRDAAAKRIRYLRALKHAGLKPTEAYLNKFVPVIPSRFRPIYPNADGSLNVSDPVHCYREVMLINNQLKDLQKMGVDQKNLAPLRAQLYGAVRGLVGLQEPLTRSANFKGFIATIKGDQNKYGLFQGHVVKRRQDLSGRSTIIPDPKLGIDDVKLPEEMAFVIYKPFVMARLRELGYMPLQAREMIEKKDKTALAALEAVMADRPVLLNRAPSLHKFSILAFKPQLAKGKAIEINPLVVKGFNADFDGDTMMVHVPVSEDAKDEAANKLLPSHNLFSPKDDSVIHAPTMEMVLGLYLMTTPKGAPKPAASEIEVLQKYNKRDIDVNTAMLVKGKTICAGQIIFNELLPKELQPGLVQIDKKKMMALLGALARNNPGTAGATISKIKDLGNQYITEIGYSFGLDDLKTPSAERNKIMAEAKKAVKKDGFGKAYADAAAKMESLVKSQTNNRLVIGGPISGAFGKATEITQTIAAPVAVKDHEGKVSRVPLGHSLAEGMDAGSYWAMIPGSRKGMMDRALSTAESGAFNKMLLTATVDQTISMLDCGTNNGLVMPVTSSDAQDRVVAKGPYKGKLLDPKLIRHLKSTGVNEITVRTPLRCQAQRGICAKCFGALENGALPEIGYHIGALAGQTIGEPTVQLTMKAFHTGGAIGSTVLGYPRLKEILEMPTNIHGKATLALVSGKVDSIAPSAGGGWSVRVNNMSHFVPKEQGLGVKKGQEVKAGDMLSAGGAVKPQELLAATNDIHKVQDQLIGDMDKVFTDAGIKVKRKIFETAIQPLTNRAEITDAGDAGVVFGVHQGDVVSVNQIEDMNAKLQKQGKKALIQYIPTVLSIKKAPQYSGDFIGQLMAWMPHQTLKKAPALGSTADIGPGGHPISTYAFGKFWNTKVKPNEKKTAEMLDDIIQALRIDPDPDVSDLDPEIQKLLADATNGS